MDLRLSEEQELVRTAARDFLGKECPVAHVRAMEEDARGYSPALWRKMAELGWMGLSLSEKFGGIGNSFLDLCILIEEQGRCRLPAPFFSTVVLGGLPIAKFGNEAQKSDYLPAIAAGDRIMAYAEAEPGAAWGVPEVGLTATRAGEEHYVLDGTKLFVPYAHTAHDMLVVARTSGASEGEVTLFLVDAESPGIRYERLETIGSDHQYEVALKDVRVPRCNVLGEVDGGRTIVEAIDEWGTAAKCAQMVGGAQRVLDMTVEHATQRVQFGRPIGTFQAVQHHCANMAVDVLGSRFIAYEAIWRVSEGMDAREEVSMAKAWVSDAYQRVCNLGHQIHGAIGFSKEHDLQLYSRHAKAAELSFGDGDYHRELLAQRFGL